MQKQQEWCLSKKYKVIETQTLKQWKEMLILNLRSGFDIKGEYNSDDFGLKIILEKNLF